MIRMINRYGYKDIVKQEGGPLPRLTNRQESIY
jgi:hypothetical protein